MFFSILGLKILILGFQRGLILDEISDFLKIFWIFLKISENIGMKKMKLFKTSKNDGLSQDFFGRAKRAGKSLILGFQEKNTARVPNWPKNNVTMILILRVHSRQDDSGVSHYGMDFR